MLCKLPAVVPATDTLRFFEVVVFVVRIIERVVFVGVGVRAVCKTLFLVHDVGVGAIGVAHLALFFVLLECVAGGTETACVFVVVVHRWFDVEFVLGVVVIQCGAGACIGAVTRTFDTKAVGDRLADVNIHLWHPEWQQVDAIGEHGRATVDEFGELGHSLDQVRGSELANPGGRILTSGSLELDLKHAVREVLNVTLG